MRSFITLFVFELAGCTVDYGLGSQVDENLDTADAIVTWHFGEEPEATDDNVEVDTQTEDTGTEECEFVHADPEGAVAGAIYMETPLGDAVNVYSGLPTTVVLRVGNECATTRVEKIHVSLHVPVSYDDILNGNLDSGGNVVRATIASGTIGTIPNHKTIQDVPQPDDEWFSLFWFWARSCYPNHTVVPDNVVIRSECLAEAYYVADDYESFEVRFDNLSRLLPIGVPSRVSVTIYTEDLATGIYESVGQDFTVTRLN